MKNEKCKYLFRGWKTVGARCSVPLRNQKNRLVRAKMRRGGSRAAPTSAFFPVDFILSSPQGVSKGEIGKIPLYAEWLQGFVESLNRPFAHSPICKFAHSQIRPFANKRGTPRRASFDFYRYGLMPVSVCAVRVPVCQLFVGGGAQGGNRNVKIQRFTG